MRVRACSSCLTSVCCELESASKISSTIRSDRKDARLSFTSLWKGMSRIDMRVNEIKENHSHYWQGYYHDHNRQLSTRTTLSFSTHHQPLTEEKNCLMLQDRVLRKANCRLSFTDLFSIVLHGGIYCFISLTGRCTDLILFMMSIPDCSSSVFLTKLREMTILVIPALMRSCRRFDFFKTWGQRLSAAPTIDSSSVCARNIQTKQIFTTQYLKPK